VSRPGHPECGIKGVGSWAVLAEFADLFSQQLLDTLTVLTRGFASNSIAEALPRGTVTTQRGWRVRTLAFAQRAICFPQLPDRLLRYVPPTLYGLPSAPTGALRNPPFVWTG
jgi:hypothetical protein